MKNWFIFFIPILLVCGCVQMGSQGAKTVATGAAAGANTENASDLLERCQEPLGTIAISEDYYQHMQNAVVMMPFWGANGSFNPHSPNLSVTPILRLLAQQSNCFVVVGRGWDYDDVMRERRLARAGELRKNSNMGKGQMVAADYSITPSITFSSNDALGGFGGLAGAFLPGAHYLGMMLGGSIKNKQAGAVLTMIDNRSGIQVAAAEGSSSSWDIGGLFGMLGHSGLGGLGAYSNTPRGKLIVAALMDGYNNMVKAIIKNKNYKPQAATGPYGMGTGGKMKTN